MVKFSVYLNKRVFVMCSSSLFVHLWFRMWCLFCSICSSLLTLVPRMGGFVILTFLGYPGYLFIYFWCTGKQTEKYTEVVCLVIMAYNLPTVSSLLKHLGPVVQSIVSLTSPLVVKMLTVLVSTISNSQVFLLIKCEQLLQSYSHFSAKLLMYICHG